MHAQIGQHLGSETVKVIRNPGSANEEEFEVDAIIQSEHCSFDVDTPIFEGDLVEVADPRRPEGKERRLAAKVKVRNSGPENLRRITVEWGTVAAPRGSRRYGGWRSRTFIRRSKLQAASGDLFADGHFESSVTEAFKSVDVRVRRVTGIEKSGAALMGDAFKFDGSVLDVAVHKGRSGHDEREGFLHNFRGSMLGIRNPGAHELFQPGDPQQALEYLGFASLRPPQVTDVHAL